MVVARNMWKHYGGASLPVLRKHYQGLRELMAWFARHADKQDGLLPPLSCTEQACGACYGDWMGFDPEAHNSGSSALTPQSSLLLGGGGGGLRSAERRAVLYRALSPTGPSPVSPLPPPHVNCFGEGRRRGLRSRHWPCCCALVLRARLSRRDSLLPRARYTVHVHHRLRAGQGR